MFLIYNEGADHPRGLGGNTTAKEATHSTRDADYVIRSDDPILEASNSIPVHPLGVKPLGNQYLNSGPSARQALGLFELLPDEMIIEVLEGLEAESLRKLAYSCRFLYACCHLDELWKAKFLELPSSSELRPWKGSWRTTYLQLPAKIVPEIDCSSVYSDVLHRPFACSQIVLQHYVTGIPPENQIPRLGSLGKEGFSQNWSETPFILENYAPSWPVYNQWSIESFKERYGHVEFRAEAVDWPFSAYHSYMRHTNDESPLYLFDRKFAEKMQIKIGTCEGAAYWPPECYGEDLFQSLGQERPAHRWLIIGKQLSGSTFHKDPNGTSAWNAVIEGSKYWLMFPPSVRQPPGVFVSNDGGEVTSPLSIAEYLLTFQAEARAQAGCKEGICRAGEVLFVPYGWWHLVVNLEDGIALTQNLVTKSHKHLTHVLSFLRDKADQVTGFSREIASPYELFVNRLGQQYPDLLKEALLELERKSAAKQRKWEAAGAGAPGEAGGRGFSFGFGGDDPDGIP